MPLLSLKLSPINIVKALKAHCSNVKALMCFQSSLLKRLALSDIRKLLQPADKLGLVIAIEIGGIKRIVCNVEIFCVGIKSLRMMRSRSHM